MYLSRVRIDPSRAGARRLLASPQRLHAVVAAATDSSDDRPLWRLDPWEGGLNLLVVSRKEPDFTSLVSQAELLPEDGWQTSQYSRFLDKLTPDQAWVFRLAANPVRSLRRTQSDGSLARGKRVPIVGDRGLREWLLERAEGIGVQLETDSFSVTQRRTNNFMRRRPDGSDEARRRVTIAKTQFDGILRVFDTDLLRQAMTHGIGGAKAYGCGLLTLAPPS